MTPLYGNALNRIDGEGGMMGLVAPEPPCEDGVGASRDGVDVEGVDWFGD